MKGFRNTGRPVNFSTSADSSFKPGQSITQQIVRPHFRSKPAPVPTVKVPKFAKGGPVGNPKVIGDQGNSVVERKDPTTTADAQHGGKGPLRTGYAKGGKIPMRGKKPC